MTNSINNERFRNLLASCPHKAVMFLNDEYARRLRRLSFKLTKDKEVSKDIVNDTFLHVYQNHVQLSKPCEHGIESYLIQLVKNKSVSYYREKIKEIENYDRYVRDGVVEHLENSIEEEIIRLELIETATAHISFFPRRERQCLLLRIFDDLPIKAIAKKLGVSPKEVERSLTCGKKRLKKAMMGVRADIVRARGKGAGKQNNG